MNTKELLNYFNARPYLIRQGAKKTALRTHSKVSDVLLVRNLLQQLKGIKTKNYKVLLEDYTIQNKVPKILIFDIETAPLLSYIWGLWKLNVHIDHIINEWFVICWSAKWLYSSDVMGDVLTPKEAINQDDKRVCLSLWELFNEADIVVAHNGDRFDIPKMNARFIINGLDPTTPYKSIDTCLVARKLFGFTSNKLDALATYFGFEHKLDTDFSLWKGCLEGNKESLDYMLEYNKRDVTLLEEVYLKLRPWIKNHPNVGNYLNINRNVCSNCGSTNLTTLKDTYYYTLVAKYQVYRCKCGCLTRGRKNLSNVNTSTISIAK